MERFCDFCQSAQEVSVALRDVPDNEGWVAGTFDIVTCRACGHSFTDPQPASADEIAGYYQPGYYAHTLVRAIPTQGKSALKQRLRRMASRRAQGLRGASLADRTLFTLLGHTVNEPAFHNGGRLLDVGCGSCEYLLAARDIGWNAAAVEPNPDVVAAALECGFPVTPGTAEATGQADGSVDVVRMWNVLEHTPSPSKALEEARRILKPGGQLIMYVPNFASFERLLFGRLWTSLEVPRHLHHFTPETLKAFLNKCGFEFSSWMYPGTYVSTLSPTLNNLRKNRAGSASIAARTAALLLLKTPYRAVRNYGHDVGIAVLARVRNSENGWTA